MTNATTEHYQNDALYTVAEDINRFAPWESNIAPFMLIDPAHPDAYVLVVMEDDGEGTSDIRLMLGLTGLRAWLAEQEQEPFADDDVLSADEFVARYDGYYLEVGYNMPNLNSYEKRQLDGREHCITFRRQRPGYGLATIVDNRDFAHLERYLRAILRLLTKCQLNDDASARYRLQRQGGKERFRTAAFLLTEDGPVQTDDFVLTRSEWLQASGCVVDEFTDARVKRLPNDGHVYELYFFYLPLMVSGKSMLPRSFFLVDLETGFIEWSEVILPESGWAETLLRRLWDFFFENGARPDQLLIQNIGAYTALAADLKRAGIHNEYISQSYVGQELLDSYLQATHMKAHQMMADTFPRDPY